MNLYFWIFYLWICIFEFFIYEFVFMDLYLRFFTLVFWVSLVSFKMNFFSLRMMIFPIKQISSTEYQIAYVYAYSVYVYHQLHGSGMEFFLMENGNDLFKCFLLKCLFDKENISFDFVETIKWNLKYQKFFQFFLFIYFQSST